MTTLSSQEFQHNQLHIKLQKNPGCQTIFEIAISPEGCRTLWERAIKEVQKHVSIPGFRKGKVPKEILFKRYKPEIEREFKDIVVNDSLQKALEFTHIFPWNRNKQIKIDLGEASVEKGGKFTAEFERYPDIPSIQPENLKINDVKNKEITEKEIDDHLENLRLNFAEWEEVKDRQAQENDFLEIDVWTFKDDGTKVKTQENARLHLHPEKLNPWLKEVFIGMNLGETRQGQAPQETPESPPTLPMEFSLKKIQLAKLPEIGEEFIKKFGAKNLDELKSQIKVYLEKNETNRTRNFLHNQIEASLLQTYPVDLPESLLSMQTKDNLEYYQSLNEGTKEDLEKKAKEQAYESLSLHFLISKLIEEKGFQVTPEEVFYEVIQERFQQSGEMSLPEKEAMDRLKNQAERRLLIGKALDYITEKAQKT